MGASAPISIVNNLTCIRQAMPISAKNGQIIVRDGNGQLVQLKPKTDASNVAYGNTTVNEALDALQGSNANGVERAYVEIDPYSTTETKEVQVQDTGYLTASADSPGQNLNVSFSINFLGPNRYDSVIVGGGADSYYNPEYGNDIWLGYFYNEDGILLKNSSKYYNSGQSIIAYPNERYYYDFELDFEDIDFVPTGINALISGCIFQTDSDGAEFPGNTIGIIGANSSNPDSEYEQLSTYNVYDMGTAIAYSLPAVGESTVLYFNHWFNFGSSWVDGVLSKRNKSLTIENFDGIHYRMSFYWDTVSTQEVTETTRWKELKTTLERGNDSVTVVNKPISGLLQDVHMRRDASYSLESVQTTGTYYPYIYVSDNDPNRE